MNATSTSTSIPTSVVIGSHQGNPVLTIGSDPNPYRNFTFGKSKANLLLSAIESHGIDGIMTLLRTVAGVSATPAPAPAQGRAERPDTATVATPTVVPTQATTTPKARKTKPKADTIERDTLIRLIKASGMKGHGLCHKWKMDTLRAKAATLETAPAPATLPVTATVPAPAPVATTPAITVAESNAKVEIAAPHIVHRAAINGKCYVLFSDGVTKLHYVRDGKDTFRKTDLILTIPVKVTGPVVMKTFRDAGTQYVLYSDGTWKSVERQDRSV